MLRCFVAVQFLGCFALFPRFYYAAAKVQVIVLVIAATNISIQNHLVRIQLQEAYRNPFT